jgi:dTDP-4-dehydrorhamnose reductase
MMKVVVTGAAGQLGGGTVRRLASRADVVGLTRNELDLTDHARVMSVIEGERPDLVINCTAYNAVDQAEDDPKTTLAVNAFAVQSLARAAAAARAVFVHYSTDFVFDGLAEEPYVETDPTNPRSVYGQSKLIGEWLAAEAPRVYVLRVESLFGGPAARSSVDKIIAALRAGREAPVFVDRIVTPSYVEDVAEATWALVSTDAPAGVYHVVNTGAATWYDLGREAARILNCAPRLRPVKVSDVPLRAPRPQYCALSNAKLARAGFRMPTWQDALERHLNSRLHS